MRANTVNAGWPSTDDAKHWDAWEANVIIDGPTGEDVVHFGYDMACNGNTNKQTDSRADLIVGAPRGRSCDFTPDSLEENRGFAYLFRVTGTFDPGEDGDHATWAAVANSAAYFRIQCNQSLYGKYAPQLGRSIVFIGDANVVANYNDDFIIGAPGWDHNTYPDSADDRGCIYMIPF